MTKLIKILGRIVGTTLEWVSVLIIFLVFAVRTSWFQTYLASIATDFLSSELKTTLRIDKVDIYFFDRVNLKGVFVRDLHGDTLASLENIDVALSTFDIEKNEFSLRKIELNVGKVGIHRDSVKGDYNYWFITDYFASESSSPPPKAPLITIHNLDLNRIDFDYQDYRKSYNEFGMDYDHLEFDNIQLHVRDLVTDGKNFNFDLRHLSTEEHAGFKLRQFKALCEVGDKGIRLKNVAIKTDKSKLWAKKLQLNMSTGLKQVYVFEDSVRFDIQLDSSTVNLSDIAQFAPELKGMNQQVSLSGDIKRRVRDLKLLNVDLRTGARTIIRGNFLLPDFRELGSSFMKESISYAYVDLNDLKLLRLPDSAMDKFIALDPMLERLGYFELKRMDFIGYTTQFVFASSVLSTQLGTFHLDNGILLTQMDEGGYAFEQSGNSTYDIKIDSFQLGKFLDEPLLGKIKGSVFMNGVFGQEDQIRFEEISGVIDACEFNEYNYSNITIEKGSFVNRIVQANIEIKDPNATLIYSGKIDLNEGQHFDFEVDVEKALLAKLNFTPNNDISLDTDFNINMKGTGIDNYSGNLDLLQLHYSENNKTISIPQLSLDLERGNGSDRVEITSNVANVELKGKVNFNTIVQSVTNVLSEPLASYFSYAPFNKKQSDNNFIDARIDVKDAEEVFAIFAPELVVANGTVITAHYRARSKELKLGVDSPYLRYDDYYANNVILDQNLIAGHLTAKLTTQKMHITDSIRIMDLAIDIAGEKDNYLTSVEWNQTVANPSRITWKTHLKPDVAFDVLLKPSYFTLKGQQWEIMNSSKLSYSDKKVMIDHLVFERDVQFIAIDGVLSDDKEDEVRVNINQLKLTELSNFIGNALNIEGDVSGDLTIATPFTAFRIDGNLTANELVINKEPIGNVGLKGNWDPSNERIILAGDLKYLKNETFDFTGYYYPYRTTNQLDFNLDFQGMDLQFANAFMDPDVLSDIRGQLKGGIHIHGDLDGPLIDGKLNLVNGNVKVAILGTNFKLNGPIEFNGKENAFYMNNLPIRDEEGNSAYLTGAINHQNFENWNVDLSFNMEDVPNQYNAFGRPKSIDRFLVMNTPYKEGEIYYGKAYVTGTANIFISDEDTEISVDLTTRKGTKIDLPMYGSSELEDVDFIQFGTAAEIEEPKIDFKGVDLDLNFKITPEAKVALIFNDKTGDEIRATGKGNLNIRSNNLGDIAMNGQYVVEEGKYNFVLGLIKQEFIIAPGGSVTWVEDPTTPVLDLKTYNIVQANLNEITLAVDQGNSSGTGNQPIKCLLYLSQTLDEPLITLDIEAPQANESGNAILGRIRSDKDELQRQFFSLLLFKKFAPLSGSTGDRSGGVYDVLEQQINDFIDGFGSKTVKMNVAYDNDAVGDASKKSVELGLSKTLGDREKIIVKGSFGVASTTDTKSADAQTRSNVIGDMSVEYLINEDGSFRVNLFNESNDNTVIQDKTSPYTQGVGLHYQEDFNSRRDFKLSRFYRRIFKKEKNFSKKSRKQFVPVDKPVVPIPPDPVGAINPFSFQIDGYRNYVPQRERITA